MSYWDYEEPMWEPSEADELNDYSYKDFGIQFVYDKFCDDVIEKRDQLTYGKNIGFTSKEECQKYCDWLNERRTSNE